MISKHHGYTLRLLCQYDPYCEFGTYIWVFFFSFMSGTGTPFTLELLFFKQDVSQYILNLAAVVVFSYVRSCVPNQQKFCGLIFMSP